MPTDPVDVVRDAALWFEHGRAGIHPILEAIGDARVVLIGEASHGTHEFYRIRADLTDALIEQRGFNIVAVEADWPDAYRANRWVRHDPTADDSRRSNPGPQPAGAVGARGSRRARDVPDRYLIGRTR